MTQLNLLNIIIKAVQKRLVSDELPEAHRLFNGYTEGCPGLVLERYGSALVVIDSRLPGELDHLIDLAVDWLTKENPDLRAVLLKQRRSPDEAYRKGRLIRGTRLPAQITEYGLTYALDLQLNQDASFYIDTRSLRQWLFENMRGCQVFNTFAYTGSLGVAAGLGGAKHVVQTDLNKRFLDIAERSWLLNSLPPERVTHLKGDFFRVAGRMRSQQKLFDCVILDPPFFSVTNSGKVDLQHETTRLVNKVRSLVAHEGWLVVINNALFLSGEALMFELDTLCQSEYISFVQRIPAPEDVTGYPDTRISTPPTDPSPFNHTTKIALLKVFRKDGLTTNEQT